jgi:hypothetical protein
MDGEAWRVEGGLRRIAGSGKEGDSQDGKRLNGNVVRISQLHDDGDIAGAQFEVFLTEVAFASKKKEIRRSSISFLVSSAPHNAQMNSETQPKETERGANRENTRDISQKLQKFKSIK